MKYKITIIQEKENNPEERYTSWVEIYDQTIEDMNVLNVVKAANGILDKENK
jgi:hypothetical protein